MDSVHRGGALIDPGDRDPLGLSAEGLYGLAQLVVSDVHVVVDDGEVKVLLILTLYALALV